MDAKKILGAFVSTVLRALIAICILYYVYQTAINAYNFGYRIFADLPCAIAPGRDISVTVTETMNDKERAKEFEKVGLVEDWKLFWVQTLLSEYKKDLEPGVYTLNNSMNSQELLAALAGVTEEGQEEGEDFSGAAGADTTDATIVNNTDDIVITDTEAEGEEEATDEEISEEEDGYTVEEAE